MPKSKLEQAEFLDNDDDKDFNLSMRKSDMSKSPS